MDIIISTTPDSCLDSLCCLRGSVLDRRCGSLGDTSCFLSRCGSGIWQLRFRFLNGCIDLDLIRSVLSNKLGDVRNSACTIVWNWRVLFPCGVELDGWETLDLVWNIVGSGVNFGDGDLISVAFVKLSQRIVLWCEANTMLVLIMPSGKRQCIRLAVATPWSVEFNQNILLVIKDNVIVVLGYNNGDWAILLLWHSLGLDAWLKLASDEVVNELANCLGSKLVGLVKWKLLVLDSLLNSESWPLVNLKVEVGTVLSKGLCVNGSEVDLALVLLGNLLEVLGEGLTLL